MRKKESIKIKSKGRSCVFVGSSAQMKGRGIGRLIDEFDIVARSLGASGQIGLHPEDLGSRTDILFINSIVERLNRPLPLKRFAEQGVKQIVFRRTSAIKKYLDKRTPLGLSRTQARGIQGIVGMPLMAAQATQWFMNEQAGAIFITGCDFYMWDGMKTNTHRRNPKKYWIDGYQKNPLLKKKKKGERRWGQRVGRPTNPSRGHDTQSHLEWYAELIKEGKVFVDDMFAKVINDWCEAYDEELLEIERVQKIRATERIQNAQELTDLIGAVR